MNKTYFGLDIYPHGVKVSDIVMIPFDSNWEDKQYISLSDWEDYAKIYIKEHHLIFPKGVYVCEYTFDNNNTSKKEENQENIVINSSEHIDETRHIKIIDDAPDSSTENIKE